MSSLRSINFTCQGESHKATDKVCQDFSVSKVEPGLAFAIVCDGHGGKRYFRSDQGSRLCAEVTEKCIRGFVENVDKSLLAGTPFTQVGTADEEGSKTKTPTIDKVFRQLFSAIISQWNQAIWHHAESEPLSDKELATVEGKYLEEFRQRKNMEKFYGCTLMAYVQTPDYWFAFHVGDGKCIAMRLDRPNVWREPIPWDERCFLNKTTSICDSSALDEFRYCFQGNGHFPDAIFLGSDGMDDSFGPIENLANFYIGVVKEIVKEGVEATQKSIEQTLPELSRRGSQDDMSLAVVFDEQRLKDCFPNLIDFQIRQTRDNIVEIDAELDELRTKLQTLGSKDLSVKNNQIQLDYARKELAAANDKRNALYRKVAKLLVEQKSSASADTYCRPCSRNLSKRQLRRLLSHSTPQSRKLKRKARK